MFLNQQCKLIIKLFFQFLFIFLNYKNSRKHIKGYQLAVNVESLGNIDIGQSQGGSTLDVIAESILLSQQIYNPLLEKFNNLKEKPDILYVDFLTYPGIDIGELFNITTIISYPNVGVYQSSSFRIPTPTTGFSIHMLWFEKIVNDLVYRIKPYLMGRGLNQLNSLRSQRNLPQKNSIQDYYNDKVVISYQSFAFEYSQLIHPLLNFVGPPQVSLTKPLTYPAIGQNTEEILEWLRDLDKYGKTVIFVSMGTTTIFPPSLVLPFYQGFETVIQTRSDIYFLWQLNSHLVEKLPHLKNEKIKIIEFIDDQEEIFKFSCVKGFFSHCGMNSVYEALLSGKPILALPFSHDQKDNAARIQDAGVGFRIDTLLPNLLAKHVNQSVISLLQHTELADNAIKIRNILKNEGGAKRAADVIENIHKAGYQHLIPKNLFHPPWWQLDQEISIYALYISLAYSQFILLRNLWGWLRNKKLKKD